MRGSEWGLASGETLHYGTEVTRWHEKPRLWLRRASRHAKHQISPVILRSRRIPASRCRPWRQFRSPRALVRLRVRILPSLYFHRLPGSALPDPTKLPRGRTIARSASTPQHLRFAKTLLRLG